MQMPRARLSPSRSQRSNVRDIQACETSSLENPTEVSWSDTPGKTIGPPQFDIFGQALASRSILPTINGFNTIKTLSLVQTACR